MKDVRFKTRRFDRKRSKAAKMETLRRKKRRQLKYA